MSPDMPICTAVKMYKLRNGTETEQWAADRIDELECVVHGLITVRQHKITVGKDELYREMQPLAWANAYKALGEDVE